MKWLACLRGLAGLAGLMLFLGSALPATVARMELHFSRGRESMHLGSLEARGRLLGKPYVQSLAGIRRLIPEGEGYFLVDAGPPGDASPLWVRYELAPRKAVLLGSLAALKPRDIRKVRRSALSWVVIASPSGAPARAVPRDEFVAEVAGAVDAMIR